MTNLYISREVKHKALDCAKSGEKKKKVKLAYKMLEEELSLLAANHKPIIF